MQLLPRLPPTPLSFISTTHRGTGGSSETPHSALAEARQLRRELGVAWGFHPSMSSPPTAASNSWPLGASQVALVIKNPPANTGDTRDAGSMPGQGRFPCRRAWQSTPVFLPRESYGQRRLRGCIVHGGAKSRTRLKWFSTLGVRGAQKRAIPTGSYLSLRSFCPLSTQKIASKVKLSDITLNNYTPSHK